MAGKFKDHWEQVYATKAVDSVSWFQRDPVASLAMIAAAGVGRDAAVVDIGGGASVLVDRLLDLGFTDVSVLDVSEHALAAAKARLGARRTTVTWLVQDVTTWEPSPGAFALWHDRAVFHFLVDQRDRDGYLRALGRGLAPGGCVVLGTFAPSGPERCSSLPVRRYSADLLRDTLGAGYELVKTDEQTHTTPGGIGQDFLWCLFRRAPERDR